MSSVAQIVRQLIEQLSEGVSELVLMVVVLQEQDADLPPHLPNAVNQVMQTASMLVKVAHQLAAINYKNFESIANEIRTAAEAVSASSASMTQSISAITSANKSDGWNSLTEACRVMAAKTIKLLQIVYAADLKRIFAVADAVLKGLGQMDASQAITQPDEFALWATALATQANQLASYIAARAKDEISPLTRQKLEEYAAKLKAKARELIDHVNELLEDPENPQKRAETETVARELQSLIGEAALFIRETQTELADFDESDLPSLNAAMKARQQAAEEAARKERERTEALEKQRMDQLRAERKAALAARQQGFAGIMETVDAPDRQSILAREIARAQDALRRLKEAAMSGDAAAFALAAEEANAALEDLKKRANEEALKTLDPTRRQQILNSIKQLEQMLPGQLTLAKRIVEDPTEADKVALRKLALDNENILASLEDATREVDLLERAMRADRAAELLARAVSDKRDVDDRHVLGEDFARLNEKVVHLGKFQAQNAVSDVRRTAIADAVSKLQNAAAVLANLAHINDNADPNTLDSKSTLSAAKDYKDALKALQEQANAEALGTLAGVVRDLDALHRHALAENRAGIQTCSVQMIKDAKSALDQARKVAKNPQWTDNPDEKARLEAAIAEVDARLKDELQTVREYMEVSPSAAASAKRKEALTKVMLAERPARDAIAYLEQLLSGQVPEMEYMYVSPGNEQAITKSAIEVNDMCGQIHDLARAMLEANEGTSEAAKAQEELERLLSSIQEESTAIIDTLAAHDPEEKVVAKAAETVEYIRQLRQAAQRDPAELVIASKRLTSMIKDLQQQVGQTIATSTNEEQIKQLEAQNAAITQLMTDTLLVTKDVIQDGIGEHKGRLESKTHLLKRAVQRTAAVVRPENHDERIMRDAAKAIQDLLKEMGEAVTNQDAQLVDQQLAKIDKSGRDYLRAAQKRKAKRNPALVDSGSDPLSEFKALASRIGHPARDLGAGVGDTASKMKEFKHLSVQMRSVVAGNNADNLVDSIAAFQDVEEALSSIEFAVDRGDAQTVTEETRKLAGLLSILSPIATSEENAERRIALQAAVTDIHAKVRVAVQQAVECLKNPSNTQLTPQLTASADAARVPIARAIALLSPCDDRATAETLREAQAAVSTLEHPSSAVPQIQKAIEASSALAANDRNDQKRQHIEQAVQQLQEKLETLENPETAATALDVKESLEDLYHMVHTDAKTDVVELAGVVKGGANEINDDLKHRPINKQAIEAKSEALAEKMADLRESAFAVSRGTGLPPTLLSQPEYEGKAPASLDAFLDSIESSYTPPKSTDKTLSELMASIKDMGNRPEPTTFEDALERAAIDIAQAIQASSQSSQAPELVASSALAADMARLAKAARAGQRQEMLLASRQVVAHLLQLINEINAVVARIGNKNPRETDRLIRAAAAMKNFGTQLKILTSVKAASIEQDVDNDETLLSITKGLGTVVTETLQNLDTAKRVILKEKP